jgi:hypothetical protein
MGARSKDDLVLERQKTEEALRASEVRYRRLFETAQDGILSCERILSFTECYLGKAGATNVILTAQTLNFQPSTVWLATAQRSDDAPECGEH